MTQQEWLLSLFPGHGFFVEAGAHDGIGDSQTKWLEDRGWDGICVEPSDAFAGLVANRRCRVDNRCLWSHNGQEVPFRQVAGNSIELSGIEECFADHWDRSQGTTILKPTVTLHTLLLDHLAPHIIQYLSLDTEGSEYAILSAHDFYRYLFLAISVEHNGVDFNRRMLRGLLCNCCGYVVAQEGAIEDWFVHRSL